MYTIISRCEDNPHLETVYNKEKLNEILDEMKEMGFRFAQTDEILNINLTEFPTRYAIVIKGYIVRPREVITWEID